MPNLYQSCARCDEAIARHARLVAHHEAKYKVRYPLSVAKAARLTAALCGDPDHIDLNGSRRSLKGIRPIETYLRERNR